MFVLKAKIDKLIAENCASCPVGSWPAQIVGRYQSPVLGVGVRESKSARAICDLP
jgi:hypothetical protein